MAGVTLLSAAAFAHVKFDGDAGFKPRNPATNIKDRNIGKNGNLGKLIPPCGQTERTDNPPVFKPGQELEVAWVAAIAHNGHFTLRFSRANDENFEEFILAEDIMERGNQNNLKYKHTVTFPDIECDTCTLQLIQHMYRNNGEFNGNYYSCYDLVLKDESGGSDTTPPENVSNVVATEDSPTEGYISVNWQNPAQDFSKALIIQYEGAASGNGPNSGTEYTANDAIGSGVVVYIGAVAETVIGSLARQTDYSFVVYAYDEALNYASGIGFSVNLPALDTNDAPSVSLMHEQESMNDTTTITQNGGLVVVRASVTDPDNGDQHSYDWSETDAALVDSDNDDNSFTFDPSGLTPGDYSVKLVVTDDGSPALSGDAMVTFTVIASGENTAPTVNLSAQQMFQEKTSVTTNEGNVDIYAQVEDAEGDTLTFDWSATDSELLDLDPRDNHFVFDPENVETGSYWVRLTVTDNGTPQKSTFTEIKVTVKKPGGGNINPAWLLVIFAVLAIASRRRLK